MRRGTSDKHWGNPRSENWSNHGQRFPRSNQRGNFHGYNQRPPGPRHWRPESNYRPRVPVWNGNNFKPPLLRLPADGHPSPRYNGPSRFSWPEHNQHSSPHAPTTPQQSQRESYGLQGEQNLYETINAVKQKLRERTMSSEVQSEPIQETQTEETNSYKTTERRRIEHSKVPKTTTVKKIGKRSDGHPSKPRATQQGSSVSDHCKRKAQVMRRKILKQLFKLDKDKLRNLLNQSETSTKYEVALNSLFKETRDAISRDIRNAAEKSLQGNTSKKVDFTQNQQVVEDEFLGHLGTMLDTDATLELSEMEPQVIAQLSKVLQEDLMGPLTDEMSVRKLANAMSDDFCNDYQYHGQGSGSIHPEYQTNQSYDSLYPDEYNNEYHSDFKGDDYQPSDESKYYTSESHHYFDGPFEHYSPNDNSYTETNYGEGNYLYQRRDKSPHPHYPYSESNNISECDHYDVSIHSERVNERGIAGTSKGNIPSPLSTDKLPVRSSPKRMEIPNQESNEFTNKDALSNIEPVSPVADVDFRLLMPQQVPFNANQYPIDPNKDAVKEESSDNIKKENDSGVEKKTSSEISCSSDGKRKSDNDSEQSSKVIALDMNIGVRKDLFEKDKSEEQSTPVAESPVSETIKTDAGKCDSGTVATQTKEQTTTKTRGTQYYIKRHDASSQVYESLFQSKSKGTQTLGENMKDRSCQTLKVDGLFSMINKNVETFVNTAVQTEEPVKCEKVEHKDVEVSCNILDDSKCIKSVDVRTLNSQSALERMKEIDTHILALMSEKISLYNLIKLSPIDGEVVKKPELFNNTYHIPIIRNKMKTNNDSSRRHSDKHTSMNRHNVDRQNRSRRNDETVSLNGKSTVNSIKSTNKQKLTHQGDSSKLQRTTSQQSIKGHSKQNEKEKDEDSRRHRAPRRNKSSVSSDSNSSKILPYSVVPCKDINNSTSKSDVVLDVNTEEQSSDISNIDNSVESMYVDTSGYPLPMDCEMVVSEEVVINSEISEDNKSVQSDIVDNKKKRPPARRCRTSSYNNSNNKLACDTNVAKHNNKMPRGGKTVPPLRIRKNTTNSESKPSPLYNLISQMGDSDGDDDLQITKAVKKEKNPTERLAVVDDNHNFSQSSGSKVKCQGNNIKMVDCSVQLERLDVSKIPNPLRLSFCMGDFGSASMSFMEDPESTILKDDTLFSSKDYENDEDCILQSQQFNSFCDTDPSIIENIEVDDTFNIIDQWDTKLFDNVGLLEDREILQDKTLMESITPDPCDVATEEEVTLKEPLYFTDHKEPIVAVQCVKNNFLAASQDGCVYYYDGVRGNLLRSFKVCDTPVTCMMLRDSQQHFYTGSLDGTLRCFNYENCERMMDEKSTHCGGIQCMAKEWGTLYIGTQSGFIVQFDTISLTMQSDDAIKFSDNAILALHAMKEGPRRVLLIAARFQEVTVKDASTGLLLRTFQGPNNNVYSLLFHSGRLYCGTSGPNVQIFDFVTGDMVGVHTGGRGAVCLEMYHGLIFTGCYDGVIYVYSRTRGEKPVAKIPGPGKMLLAMAIVNNRIIAACKDKQMSIIPLPPEVIKLLER